MIYSKKELKHTFLKSARGYIALASSNLQGNFIVE